MGKDGVGVRIDEAGKDDAVAAIDLGDALAVLLDPRVAQRVFRLADGDDLAAEAEDGGVFNNAKPGKGSAAPRAGDFQAGGRGP